VNEQITKPLLVEIGCEEIPARFLEHAQSNFGERLQSALVAERVMARDAKVDTYSTPRRLVAHSPAILPQQADIEETILGPSAKASFDAAGRPTRAAEGFAAQNGRAVSDLVRIQTPKGEYVSLLKLTAGRQTEELLGEILPGVISGMEFPKSMVWPGKNGLRFVRPIRWIMVVFGDDFDSMAASFPIISGLSKALAGSGIAVGYETRGHRLLGVPNPFEIQSFEDYAKKLRDNYVEFDRTRRRQRIDKAIQGIVHGMGSGLSRIPDAPLEDWLVNSTEWPTAIAGSFDSRFLKLPREILITVMRNHQHYFALQDAQGNLVPKFVTVLNMNDDPKGLIRQGHERVLTARFRDAEFFWESDQRIPLRDRLPILDRVIYQRDLGTYGDKVRRMKMIAGEICQLLEGKGSIDREEAARALRAVELSKCDLTTQMVQEFTELQGEVGGLYAATQGEAQAVADAIYDHYRPVAIGDELPRSLPGAIVSLADKLDIVVGAFKFRMQPTGSSDAFGVRRAGNAIVKVLVEFSNPRLPLSLHGLVDYGLAAHGLGSLKETGGISDKLEKFFLERMAFYMEQSLRIRYDTVRAVLGAQWNLAWDAVARAQALEQIRDSEDFVALAAAAKRTRNILEKSATPEDLQAAHRINAAGLSEPAERNLYNAYCKAWDLVHATSEGRVDYASVFSTLAALRQPVDSFFDKVLVMDNDRQLRRNRLALLHQLNNSVFSHYARLSEIVVDSNVDASTSKASQRKS
jgi:glycyl-tRNA synthetase beta chain